MLHTCKERRKGIQVSHHMSLGGPPLRDELLSPFKTALYYGDTFQRELNCDLLYEAVGRQYLHRAIVQRETTRMVSGGMYWSCITIPREPAWRMLPVGTAGWSCRVSVIMQCRRGRAHSWSRSWMFDIRLSSFQSSSCSCGSFVRWYRAKIVVLATLSLAWY